MTNHLEPREEVWRGGQDREVQVTHLLAGTDGGVGTDDMASEQVGIRKGRSLSKPGEALYPRTTQNYKMYSRTLEATYNTVASRKAIECLVVSGCQCICGVPCVEGREERNTRTLKVMLGDRIRDDLLSFLLFLYSST